MHQYSSKTIKFKISKYTYFIRLFILLALKDWIANKEIITIKIKDERYNGVFKNIAVAFKLITVQKKIIKFKKEEKFSKDNI